MTRRAHHRRGSVYVFALSTTLIVAALAVSALTTVRNQRRRTEDGRGVAQAQLYARAAIDMAMHRIRTDAACRTKFSNGTWATDQAIGDGFYSFTATDPTDNDLLDSTLDPVLVLGTGKCGGATQKLEATIEVRQPGFRAAPQYFIETGSLRWVGN
jgi:Tfp pilus assembly protein PilX